MNDVQPYNMAIGSCKDTLHKVFIMDFASALEVSSMNTPRNDLFLLGIVLLEINGVNLAALDGIDVIANWDSNHIKVSKTAYKPQ